MKTVEELSFRQRLHLRWNDWRLLRKLREMRRLFVSFGLDSVQADAAVAETIRNMSVAAFDKLDAITQQQHRDRVLGLWLADQGTRP